MHGEATAFRTGPEYRSLFLFLFAPCRAHLPVMTTGRMHRTAGAFAALGILSLMLGCATTGRPTAPVEVRVRFSVKAPEASSVSVVGSFNQWDPGRHRLAGPDREGVWQAEITLLPGRHEYLFLIDGTTWVPDASAAFVDDGMGGRNSVVIVGPE